MATEQAEPASESFDDLAQFLVDNPGADEQEEKQAPPDPDAEASDKPDEEEEADPAEDEDESESEEAKKQSSLKFKVPVKGEDGTETTLEVDAKELVAGYQRHSDYTRKTQELADKEREAFQVVTTKIEEGRNYFLQQAQLAQAAVRQLAGLRSPDEMAVLAQTDPSEWVREQQRERAIGGVLTQLQSNIQREQQQVSAQQQEAISKQFSHAWGVLGKEGIDKGKLSEIYTKASKAYGIPMEKFANVYDPALVLAFRDATAYRDLKEQKAAVTKKAKEAPALPAQRQSVPRNEQKNQKLNAKFSGGRAKLNDLAAYLEANNL